MRLKTFSAPSLTQAMADVRREMGPDAVIIATSDAPGGGVQVRAAAETAYVREPAEPVRERAERLHAEAEIERGMREDGDLDRVIRALGFHRTPGSAAQALIRAAHDPGSERRRRSQRRPRARSLQAPSPPLSHAMANAPAPTSGCGPWPSVWVPNSSPPTIRVK